MPIQRPDSIPLGMPSAKALQIAAEAVRRHYVVPETTRHSVVRAECLQLAYLIQAYGLASRPPETHPTSKVAAGHWAACQDDPPLVPDRARQVARDARALELLDA